MDLDLVYRIEVCFELVEARNLFLVLLLDGNYSVVVVLTLKLNVVYGVDF